MSKRFSDTNLWQEAWFAKLPIQAKMFWLYINSVCDPAGVWSVNMDWASFAIGAKVTEAEMIAALEGKIEPNFKSADPRHTSTPLWYLPGFVASQFKYLQRNGPIHQGTIRALTDHGLLDRVSGLIKAAPAPKLKKSDLRNSLFQNRDEQSVEN